jgi:hypothetical protein
MPPQEEGDEPAFGLTTVRRAGGLVVVREVCPPTASSTSNPS